MLKIFDSLFHSSPAVPEGGRHHMAGGLLVGLLGLPLWLPVLSGQALAAGRLQSPPVDESFVCEAQNRLQEIRAAAGRNHPEAADQPWLAERSKRRTAAVKNNGRQPAPEIYREDAAAQREPAVSVRSRANRRDSAGAFSPAPHRVDMARTGTFDWQAPTAWRDETTADRNTAKRRTTVGRSKAAKKSEPAPREYTTFVQQGVASWYGGRFHGRKTANGERYDQNGMTAAHKTLPFGSIVEVTNERNGKNVVVRINDRGPFYKGRVIDLSREAARILDMDGIAPVTVKVVAGLSGEAPTLN